MDKLFWQAVRDADCRVPDGYTPADLAPALMEALASTDAELRDGLAYAILATWIEWGSFSGAALHQLATRSTRNLEGGLGETESDSVFLRTFSILILAEIVTYDCGARVLSVPELHGLMEAGLEYLAAECDLRGYVPGKGWAHSVAHSADFLRALVSHPALGTSDLERVLEAITAKVTAPTRYPYLANEEDRLALVAIAVLRREMVTASHLASWLDSIATAQPWADRLVEGEQQEAYHNARAFLGALHLHVEYQEVALVLRDELLPEIRRALKQFAPWWL